MLDDIKDKAKSSEYRAYKRFISHFNYSDEVLAQIKAKDPRYTYVTTVSTWENELGFVKKRNLKTGKTETKMIQIKLPNAKNPIWMCDISQMVGKSPPKLYSNICTDVDDFERIYDSLVSLSALLVVLSKDTYYSGVSQDSYIQDGKIFLRAGLRQTQIILALLREIVKYNQPLPVVAEAATYIVCRHLNIDVSDFSFGYILELLNYDTSLEVLKEPEIQNAIKTEAEVIISKLAIELTGDYDVADGYKVADDYKVANNANETNLNSTGKEVSNVNDTNSHNQGDAAHADAEASPNEEVPDKTVTISQMQEYGYYDLDMLPLNYSAAVRLINEGHEIFKLFNDNTELLINNTEEASRHSGYFGITHSEWFAAQKSRLAKSIYAAQQELDKPDNTNKAVAANSDNGNLQIDTNEKPEQSHATYSMFFGADGVVVSYGIVVQFSKTGSLTSQSDDISDKKLNDHSWLEIALPKFFKETNFNPKHVPYFEQIDGVLFLSEMQKINELMLYYCTWFISETLSEYSHRLPETGNMRYDIKKSVNKVREHYNDRHISIAARKWIDDQLSKQMSMKIKTAFYNQFEAIIQAEISAKSEKQLQQSTEKKSVVDKIKANTTKTTKTTQAAPQHGKKETPFDLLKRMEKKKEVLAEDANAAASVAAINTDNISNKSTEILYEIERYIEKLEAQSKSGSGKEPKKVEKPLQIMPPMPVLS